MRIDVMGGPASEGVSTIGLMGLARFGLLDVGVDTTWGGQGRPSSYGNVSAATGLGWQMSFGMRLDLLGELGATSYSGVGGKAHEYWGDNDPGVSGWTGTARAKAGLSYVFFPHQKGHLVLGVWGYAEDDLSRQTLSDHYTNTPQLSGGSLESTSHTLGTSRVGGLLSFGGVLPL